MKVIRGALIVIFLGLAGCQIAPQNTLTPLEIQSLQTREYEHGKDIVFPSVMSVFQDLGYTIKSADKDTGLITAQSAAKSDAVSKILLGVSDVSQTSATAFIEQIGKMTKVRLSFVAGSQKSYGYGQTDRQETPILTAETYKNAFERIESAIFVRSSN
ncbi:MAG: hypothetical protein U1E99_10695 [Agitococcus sp.]